MIKHIRKAFYEILAETSWMDKETKAIALDKAKSMKELIGYSQEILNKSLIQEFYEPVSKINNC